MGKTIDLLEGLLDLLGINCASDVTVPNRLLFVIDIYQPELFKLKHCSLKHVLRVNEGAAHSFRCDKFLLEFQIHFVDSFESVGSPLMLAHIVDYYHDEVFRKGAG